MFTSVGKKQMIAAIDTFGASPLPSSSTRIGAVATTGIAVDQDGDRKERLLDAFAVHEHASRWRSRRCCRGANPHTASNAVGPRLAISMSNFCIERDRHHHGDGAMNGRTWKTATSAHQTNSSAAPPSHRQQRAGASAPARCGRGPGGGQSPPRSRAASGGRVPRATVPRSIRSSAGLQHGAQMRRLGGEVRRFRAAPAGAAPAGRSA